MPPTIAQMQEALVSRYAEGERRTTWHDAIEVIRDAFREDPPADSAIHQALWELAATGLTYFRFDLHHTPVGYHPTPRVFEVAAQRFADPDFASGYLRDLRSRVPSLTEPTQNLVTEALAAYGQRAYLAASVMLGVASEAAMLEVAEAFALWLTTRGTPRLRDLLARRLSYARVFEEVRTRLAGNLGNLPPPLQDGLEGILAVGDVLRRYRNDAGHPTGRRPTREECHRHFVVLPGYLERLVGLENFFRQ